MHRTHRRLQLRPDTLRRLTAAQLGAAAGGIHPTFGAGCAQLRGTTSEAEGAGPCPGEYSFTCSP